MEMSYRPQILSLLQFYREKFYQTPSEDKVVVNELHATLWMEQNTPNWYLRHCITRKPGENNIYIVLIMSPTLSGEIQIYQILLTLKLKTLSVKMLVKGM